MWRMSGIEVAILIAVVVFMVAMPKPTADATEFFEPFSDFNERVLRKRLN